jgi:uncharacterized peroxidase-related enzyme
MPRLSIPATNDAAPAGAQPMLQAVQTKLGMTPNLFRLVANSPAALEGYLSLSGALDKSHLSAALRERIALAVAEINGCTYCLSAHTYIAGNLAKLGTDEIAANRNGRSTDEKSDAAVRFAAKVVHARGHVSDADVAEVKAAGFDDAQVIEIVLTVALNTWTNYVNEVARTTVDFPVVTPALAA